MRHSKKKHRGRQSAPAPVKPGPALATLMEELAGVVAKLADLAGSLDPVIREATEVCNRRMDAVAARVNALPPDIGVEAARGALDEAATMLQPIAELLEHLHAARPLIEACRLNEGGA